jgi:hypothetical protein
MRLGTLALALALPFAALPQDAEGPPRPPPRMPADETPTHYACTLERLLRDERCTFEFDPAPRAPSDAVARDNSKTAAVAARDCADAATPRDEQRPDATLRKMCEDDIAGVALDGCSLGGRIPLQDPQGRVASGASGCTESLSQVLARTRTMAGFSIGCCRCLAGSRCAVPLARCNREMVELAPGEDLQPCIESSCKNACSAAQREDPLLKPPPLPPLQPRNRKASAEPPLKI